MFDKVVFPTAESPAIEIIIGEDLILKYMFFVKTSNK